MLSPQKNGSLHELLNDILILVSNFGICNLKFTPIVTLSLKRDMPRTLAVDPLALHLARHVSPLHQHQIVRISAPVSHMRKSYKIKTMRTAMFYKFYELSSKLTGTGYYTFCVLPSSI